MAIKYKLTENRVEGNKLIAEFLGGEIYPSYVMNGKQIYGWKGTIVEKYREVVKLPIIDSIMLYDLEFDGDWNVLMWVVEEIEKRGFFVLKGFDNSFIIGKSERMQAKTIVESTDSVVEPTKGYTKVPDTTIDALWWCIVKFCKWYESTRTN